MRERPNDRTMPRQPRHSTAQPPQPSEAGGNELTVSLNNLRRLLLLLRRSLILQCRTVQQSFLPCSCRDFEELGELGVQGVRDVYRWYVTVEFRQFEARVTLRLGHGQRGARSIDRTDCIGLAIKDASDCHIYVGSCRYRPCSSKSSELLL